MADIERAGAGLLASSNSDASAAAGTTVIATPAAAATPATNTAPLLWGTVIVLITAVIVLWGWFAWTRLATPLAPPPPSAPPTLAAALHAAPPALPPSTLRLLIYNVQLLPWPVVTDGGERAAAIAALTAATLPDIAVFCECFDPFYTRTLVDGIAGSHTYWTRPLDDAGVGGAWVPRLNGGVLVASRTPLRYVRPHYFAYAPLFTPDSLAAKGIVHVVIAWTPAINCHILAVHMHSEKGPASDHARKLQCAQIAALVEEIRQAAPKDAIVICGDLNYPTHDAGFVAAMGGLRLPQWLGSDMTFNTRNAQLDESLDAVIAASANVTVMNTAVFPCDVNGRGLSDHGAVVAAVSLRATK